MDHWGQVSNPDLILHVGSPSRHDGKGKTTSAASGCRCSKLEATESSKHIVQILVLNACSLEKGQGISKLQHILAPQLPVGEDRPAKEA